MPRTALTIAQRLEEEHRPRALEPTWSDDNRAVSKELARSALFHVRSKTEKREKFDEARIASWVRTEIRYSGEELRQDDQEVFMQLVHMMRKQELGNEVTILGYDLLKQLGWGFGADKYERLFQCIKRMLEGTVWVYNPDRRGVKLYGSHLIHTVVGRDADAVEKERLREQGTLGEDEGHGVEPARTVWTIYLDRNLANIMTDDHLTLIDWVRHLSLTPLGKWFHVFYSTHRDPSEHPMSPRRFRELTGSKQKNLATFRQRIKKALDELVEKGFLEKYEYDDERDTFSVTRVPARVEEKRQGQMALPL